MVLFYISLLTIAIEHLSVCFFTICISFGEVSGFFACFKKRSDFEIIIGSQRVANICREREKGEGGSESPSLKFPPMITSCITVV